jgi:diguanylate cyclase (GGDEF)-like protein
MMALEVIAHAVAAVIVVGWDGGFHFYLLLLIPAILASRLSGWPPKIAAATAVGLIYTTLDSCWRQAPPLQPINSLILTQLHHFNLVATLFLLGVLTVVYVRMIDRAETRLNEQANTDSLTQLVNRRSILAAIERQQALRQRNPHPLCLIIIDIDHFKLLNDAHGHALGDRALQAVAKALQQGVREIDLVARWGGEEFLVVLPFADMDVAVPVAERLRESIAALRIEHQGQLLSMTGTLGLSELAVGEAADTGIQRADAALYRGKNGGRDQVVVG